MVYIEEEGYTSMCQFIRRTVSEVWIDLGQVILLINYIGSLLMGPKLNLLCKSTHKSFMYLPHVNV